MSNKIKNVQKLVTKTDDNPIFKYIKPEENNDLSNMTGSELQDFLYYLNKSYLSLRNRLGFRKYVTFGIEIEFEKTKGLYAFIKKQDEENIDSDSWIAKNDGSLDDGIEIESPILRDSEKTWSELNKICKLAQSHGKIFKNSGGHVHVGAQVLGKQPKSWLNFLKLWSVYENIIFRFCYGEYLSPRPKILDYAEPQLINFFEEYMELKDEDNLDIKRVIEFINYGRNQAVNFSNVSNPSGYQKENTIEFRCPNGTLEPVIWQNNINLLVNLLMYSNSLRYDDDIIIERKNRLEFVINNDEEVYLDMYNEIYLEQALEFADLIFKTNYDKIYFLRQYVKNYQTANKYFVKAKPFVKTLTKK